MIEILTRLRKDEKEDHLKASWYGTQTDHPSPTAIHALECRTNAICNDLTERDHDNVKYHESAT